jgi:hypothetical protein
LAALDARIKDTEEDLVAAKSDSERMRVSRDPRLFETIAGRRLEAFGLPYVARNCKPINAFLRPGRHAGPRRTA